MITGRGQMSPSPQEDSDKKKEVLAIKHFLMAAPNQYAPGREIDWDAVRRFVEEEIVQLLRLRDKVLGLRESS
jgi:hypothetical protein